MKKQIQQNEPKQNLNQIITHTSKRANGTTRISWDYSNCPSMAEQHSAHLTDINLLMEKYKPDELAAYIVARGSWKREILGHDFSQELTLQDARNVVVESRRQFELLPDEIKQNFRSHVDFLKFLDNPANAEKMVKLGWLTQQQIDSVKLDTPNTVTNNNADDVGGQGGGTN